MYIELITTTESLQVVGLYLLRKEKKNINQEENNQEKSRKIKL